MRQVFLISNERFTLIPEMIVKAFSDNFPWIKAIEVTEVKNMFWDKKEDDNQKVIKELLHQLGDILDKLEEEVY